MNVNGKDLLCVTEYNEVILFDDRMKSKVASLSVSFHLKIF